MRSIVKELRRTDAVSNAADLDGDGVAEIVVSSYEANKLLVFDKQRRKRLEAGFQGAGGITWQRCAGEGGRASDEHISMRPGGLMIGPD